MPTKTPTRMRNLWPALAVLLLLATLWVVFTRTGPLAPIKVTEGAVKTGSVSPQRFGIGTVEAKRTWSLGPTATSRIRSLTVDVGDRVQVEQVLAEMDAVDYDERLRALDASVARANSQREAAAALAQDSEARLALARANHQRNQDLARQQFISAGALESREQELRSAQAALAAAQSNARASLQEAQRLQAERSALKEQRERLRLQAPADSVVVARDGEAGATIVAGQTVFKLVDPDALWLRVRIDQGQSAGLAVGTQADVVLRSLPQQKLPGRVVRLEWLADSVTEERQVLVALDQTPAGVSIGEMAEVTLQLPTTEPGLLVPSASLQNLQGRSGVWRQQEGRAQFVPVQIIARDAQGLVQVKGVDGKQPLAEGDKVVVHSQRVLTPDARLRIVPSLVPTGSQP